jgi:flagellar protein FlgJ
MANAINVITGGYLQTGGYMPFSAGTAAAPGLPNEGGRLFSELLEKSKAPEPVRDAKEPAGRPLEQPVIERLAGQPSSERPFGRPSIDKTDKLYEQCQALETFLIKNLITSMRSTVQKSELLDTGFAGKMYEDMLYDEYANEFSKSANFGFAEMAYLELSGQRGKIPVNHLV